MFSTIGFCLLLLNVDSIVSAVSKENTLVSLHILFRHGERSPTKTYTNDPYKNYSWPGGLDQLTNKGKIEMYDLGLSFRKRYDSFLTDYYLPDDVIVQSSYADRCHMSAQLLLAALYPPVNEQIWNEELPWQPIPIHSVPRRLDNKIAVKMTCPGYERELSKAFQSDGNQNHDQRKDLYDYLSQNTGDSIQTLLKLESLYNTLEIESVNNLTLPDWTLRVFPDKMKHLAALSLATFTRTDFMKRINGILLKEIVDNMLLKRQGKLKPNRKVFLYSGHDLTVVSLMRVLGFDELLKPEFGAAVIFEQHNVDGLHIVKVLYQRNPYADASPKDLPYCNYYPCPLDTFQTTLEKYMTDDWVEECNVKQQFLISH